MQNAIEEAEKLIRAAEDPRIGCDSRPLYWQEAVPLIEALGGKIEVARCDHSATICIYIAALMVRKLGAK